MTKNMLIDAAHAEETRVAVVDGSRIEELDFEIASRRQLRGNIYLAKVVRVEPSLQAAFIEYGGNRHGFLAFNEIHPDYYQIPHADREALMREVADDLHHDDGHHDDAGDDDGEHGHDEHDHSDADHGENGEGSKAEAVTHDDDDDAMEQELERRRRRLMRRYKIQEVIRRRQIMLVQVVKEERGNKGAALTTYLSLAGRYSVLMPNTARGGGISRKIDSAADRKRLKAAVQSLDVPTGMGLIVRTAGAERTKTEIKRDYDYLLRLWESIRETTLKSTAPAQIYAEEDLVKRAIRDMYDKDIDQILVEGDAGYREARDFMRMIMPSMAKKVVRYAEPTPLFVRHRVEDQLAQIHSPIVPLKSGGYLVINQTEALVAIDVNSGRATRERNIETTAFKTNMEAAEEASRQLRLRDLAGLIVIDFIDMDEGKNNRAVEKKLKDSLKDDRARVQMGKISVFGLMEISRQRRRMGVLEGATNPCPTCHGVGRVRSVESSALAALRALDVEGARGAGSAILKLPTEVALYVLNSKRGFLSRLEDVHDLTVTITVDDALANGEHAIERTETREAPPRVLEAAAARARLAEPEEIEDDFVEPVEEDEEEADADTETAGESRTAPARDADDESRRGGRRRRRRRGGRGRDDALEPRAADGEAADEEDEDASEDGAPVLEGESDRGEDGDGRRRRRRRGRRGGRRMREEGAGDVYAWSEPNAAAATAASEDPYVWRDAQAVNDDSTLEQQAEAPRGVDPVSAREAAKSGGRPPRRAGPGRNAPAAPAPQVDAAEGQDAYAWSAPEAVEAAAPAAVEAVEATPEPEAPAAKPKRVRAPRKPKAKPEAAVEAEAAPAETPTDVVAEAPAVEAPEAPAPSAAVTPAPEAAPEPAAPEPAAVEAPAAVVAPQPVLQAVPSPAPVVPAAPDPNEISAPPVQPKRGWWNRR